MGELYIVATPIGNLNDISARALSVLESVDLIAAEDTRVTKKLLNHFNIKTNTVSYHKYNEIERSKEIINKIINNNISVAITSDAGTPCISDPGSILINEAINNNIKIISIPGPVAFVSALVVSGFDLTEFTFHGFLPRNQKDLINKLKEIKSKSKISVFYESPNRILSVIKTIANIDNYAKVSLSKEITKIHETTLRGDINEILCKLENNENVNKGEYCLVIEWGKDVQNNSYNPLLEISLEAKIYNLFIKNVIKEDIFKLLIENGEKKNDIYKTIINLEKKLNIHIN